MSKEVLLQGFFKWKLAATKVPFQASTFPNQNLKEKSFLSTKIKDAQERDLVELAPTDVVLRSASYGLFLHALEDEFSQVRLASLNAIRELCLNDNLSEMHVVIDTAKEFVIDMLNDEILAVRVRGIEILKDLAKHIHHTRNNITTSHSPLKKFKRRHEPNKKTLPVPGLCLGSKLLDPALTSVLDLHPRTRALGREFFSYITLPSVESLEKVIVGLRRSYESFPRDLVGVLWCFNKVGRNHVGFVEEKVKFWLGLDEQFMCQERDIEDTRRASFFWSGR